MKVGLIRPGRKMMDQPAEESRSWPAIRYIYNKWSHVKFGPTDLGPPLALMLIASITPSNYEITIIDEEVEEIDFDQNFDLVGITLLTRTAKRGYEIADEFRSRGVKVVLGGIHATVLPEEATCHADVVVLGEAELVWSSLLKDLENGSLRKIYHSSSLIDMADVPEPRRDLVNHDKYLTVNLVQATRGCPHRCSFCSVHTIVGTEFRARPIQDVVNEISKFTIPGVVFVDDNIIGDPVYAKNLFKALIPLNIWWFGQVSLGLTDDDELLDLAAKSGLKAVLIGFESLASEGINTIGKAKTNNVSSYARSIEKLHKKGISITGSFIMGLDTDTPETFDHLAKFIIDSGIDIPKLCMLTPYPGTALFNKMKKTQRLLHTNWEEYAKPYALPSFVPNNMTPDELAEQYFLTSRKIYSLRAIIKRFLKTYGSLESQILLPSTAVNLKERTLAKQVESNKHRDV